MKKLILLCLFWENQAQAQSIGPMHEHINMLAPPRGMMARKYHDDHPSDPLPLSSIAQYNDRIWETPSFVIIFTKTDIFYIRKDEENPSPSNISDLFEMDIELPKKDYSFLEEDEVLEKRKHLAHLFLHPVKRTPPSEDIEPTDCASLQKTGIEGGGFIPDDTMDDTSLFDEEDDGQLPEDSSSAGNCQ